MKMGNRTRLLTATALVASGFFTAQAATAQEASGAQAAAPQEASSANIGDIVVTGTRVVRDGYQAPNPTSVLGSEDIAAKAPLNIADVVNQMPALAGSVTPRNNSYGVSGGNNGINALNLRNLGVPRTLVLLDGQRVGASSLVGYVDIDQFPQALIKRVDVVTGGASADWGSDAVAGVVNFVLDRQFKGLKGEAQGGVTTYGDNRNYKLSLAGGTGFAGDRGHILLAGEMAHNDGITSIGDRDWYDYSKIFVNPSYTATNGQPQLLSRVGSGFQNATPGGIIASGPLRGIYFGEGGTPLQFQYGSPIGGNIMQGGQYKYADWGLTGDLEPRLTRKSAFGYASFDITDNVQIFAQLSWGDADYSYTFGTLPRYGNITVNADNAFLPESVRTQAAALGVTSFSFGSMLADLGPVQVNTSRSTVRPVIGLRGNFDALGSDWSWDIYGERTVAKSYVEANTGNLTKLLQASDAVRAPNGTIVCRSTLANPTNGCVPFNLFGTGVNSQASVDYARGTAWLRTRLQQDVAAANLRGNPFSTWAGPVSVAMGVEHRKEQVRGSNDPLSPTRPFFVGNYLASRGSYHVTEGYLQTVIPLAKDMSFAESLDLLAGVRATDYSTSGYVTTWKVGLTYKPIEDITFRVTRSRDIRAPNLAELFQANQATTVTFKDPAKGNANITGFQVTSGNQNLKPEEADSLGLGVVLQPRFLPGFAMSVDYWNIEIGGAITTIQGQTLVDQCAAGNTPLCAQITRNAAGDITTVAVQPLNLSKQVARGLDFEASYRAPLFDGTFRIRALATRNLKNVTDNGITAPVTILGKNQGNNADATALPYWSYNVTVGWDSDPISLQISGRGFSAGKYNPMYVECTSSCPTSTSDHQTIEDNHLPGALYFDAYMSYKFGSGIESFFSVENIANKSPAQVPWLAGGSSISIDRSLYDVVGRTFRAGIRFKM